jgi:hypothetical protein
MCFSKAFGTLHRKCYSPLTFAWYTHSSTKKNPKKISLLHIFHNKISCSERILRIHV